MYNCKTKILWLLRQKNTSTVYHKSELLFAAKNIMRLSPGLLMRNACLTSPDLPTQDSLYSQIS